jgi:hypothetical protein
MEQDFLKSVAIVENNFLVKDTYIRKWKNATFADYDVCYHEMFAVMKKNMDKIDSNKVNYWLEITAYFFNYKSKFFNYWKHNIIPLEIEE